MSDSDYYVGMPRDVSNSIQTKSNHLMSVLKKRNMISREDAKEYHNYNKVINKFYGLPKVNKPQLALRPIISGVHSPNRCIAESVSNILTILYNKANPFFTHDFFQFSNFIDDFQLPVDFVVVSLIAVSLFSIFSPFAKNIIRRSHDAVVLGAS